MTWEVFRPVKAGRRPLAPMVSIGKQGLIYFNKTFRKQFVGCGYVQILYEKGSKRIAFKQATNQDDFAISLTRHERGFFISGKRIFVNLKLPVPKTRSRYEVKWEKDLAIIELNKPV